MKNFHYISFLRIIAMFSIVAAHIIATPVIYNSAEYSVFWLDFSVVLAEIFRGGVYIFIAISGALFLQPEKELTLSKLFKKYVLRIVLALLIFGTLFALMEIVFTERAFHVSQLIEAFLRMLQNQSWGHLWYLYMLAGLYLVTPVFKRFINVAPKEEIIYSILILFSFNLIFPLLEKYFSIKIGFYIPLIGNPIFFYLLGYALHAKLIYIPDWLSIVMIAASLIVFMFECLFGVQIDTVKVVFKSFSSTALASSLIPISLFSLALNHCKSEVDEKQVAVEKKLSELSFGVYIFHAVFINFIYKVLHLSPATMPVPLMWCAVFVVTSILSLLTTYILRCIPFVRKYIL